MPLTADLVQRNAALRIRQVREARRLEPTEVAKRLRIPVQNYTRIENDLTTNLTLETLTRLANVFEVLVPVLLELPGTPVPSRDAWAALP